MNRTAKCDSCGAPLADDAPGGHCPACLIALAVPLAAAPQDRGPIPGPRTVERFFGDYEIVREIARGGMGIVYRARQVSLDRDVALKMIAAGPLAAPGFIERFHLEAEAAARLHHPNIVPIYEVGEYRGQHFLSMKLIEGEDLAKRMAKAECRMSKREAARFIVRIARAVHHAHQHGILHRDLKPGNILLDAGDEPHVTDFGLAKIVEHDSRLTQTGALLGTPAYMAPEQAAPEGTETSVATDVYSLGAILYHLLAGRPVFQGTTVIETMRQVVEAEPKPLHAVATGIDRDLETICLKCLNKSPRDRYASADTLAEDLERWQAGETILARPASSAEKFWRWCRRQPALAALSTAVLLLLVTVAVVSTIAAVRLRHARDEVVRAGRATERELIYASLAQAQSARRSAYPGFRGEAIEALRRAALIDVPPPRPVLELRNEAIACLTAPDLRPLPPWPDALGGSGKVLLDPAHERYVLAATGGVYVVRSLADHRELMRLDRNAYVNRETDRTDADRLWAISPDGRWLASRFDDGSLRIRVIAPTPFVWQLGGVGNIDFGRSSFAPDSQRVAIPKTAAQLRIIALTNGGFHEIKQISAPGRFDRFAWAPQGERLAFYLERGSTMHLADTLTGALLRSANFPATIRFFAWHPNGVSVAVAAGNDLLIWDSAADAEPRLLAEHAATVRSVSFSDSGRMLATVARDGQLRVFAYPDGRELASARVNDEPERVHFLDHDREIAVLHGNPLRLAHWTMVTGAEFFSVDAVSPSSPSPAVRTAVSPDGLWRAELQDGRRVQLRRAATGEDIAALEINVEATSVLWSAANELAVLCADGQTRRWHLRALREQLAALKLDW